ncbi:unnamed protein product [Paramecium octaurelia]|uniref:Uncharacterized protein n=1 Tax=Paramecium octaurelia TaxID=43137 RepID=A0A8S1TRD0_PAROT|nr:unnamed protein product [Paramecium octaurelia]
MFFLIVKLKIFFELHNLGNDQNINQEWKIFFQEFHDYFCSKKATLSNSQVLKQGALHLNNQLYQNSSKFLLDCFCHFCRTKVIVQNFYGTALHNQTSIQNEYQLLLMNSNFYQDLTSKRVKERSIGDAYDRVKQWRYFFRNGIQENGIQKKVTLKEAADLVKVPKKTLEDYIQIFNKAELIVNIEEISEKKMGYLRSFMKKNKSKIRKAMIHKKQQQIEENLKKQNQEVYENTKQNKNEDESITSPYPYQQNILSDFCDDQNDWEQYSNNIFKIFPNPHFD